jgi:hypothetical protein
MNRHRAAAVLATLALSSVAVAGGGVSAHPGHDEAQVTAKGAGKAKLKKGYATLRRQGVIYKIQRGCELGGGKTRSARLKAPLEGQVNFTLRSPRRVAQVTITGGAAAKGVGIGATIEEIQAAFPNATVNRDTEEVFGVTLVSVPKVDGGRFEYAVSTATGQATTIGIPRVSFCE